MAAPNHETDSGPQFDILAKEIKGAYSNSKPISERRTNLLSVCNEKLFLWANNALSVVNLKHEALKTGNIRQVLEFPFKADDQVDELLVEPCGSHVALVCTRGVKVIQIHMHQLLHTDKSIQIKPPLCIDERYFSRTQHSIVKVRWHPQSPTSSYISILMSNWEWRTYDVAYPDNPCDIVLITPPISAESLDWGHDPVARKYCGALGERPVSFAFGKPISRYAGCPVYFLMETGEVFYYLFSSNNMSPQPKRMPNPKLLRNQPLTMYPPSDDNYSNSFCDIITLSSDLPVLILVTARGLLYNCVVVPTGGGDNANLDLLVYDSLQLDLPHVELLTIDHEFPLNFSPLRLYTDVSLPSQALCCHLGGITLLSYPWLNKIQSFLHADDGVGLGESYLALSQAKDLFCTEEELEREQEFAPVGFAIVTDPQEEPYFICLFENYDVFIINFGMATAEQASILYCEEPSVLSDTSAFESNLSLLEEIRKTLNSVPKPTPFKFKDFPSYKHVHAWLTEEYTKSNEQRSEALIKCQDMVDKRKSKLLNISESQKAKMEMFDETKEELQENAIQLADRIEDTKEQNEVLTERVKAVLHHFKIRKSSVLSTAEVKMSKHLTAVMKSLADKAKSMNEMKRDNSVYNKVLALGSCEHADPELVVYGDRRMEEVQGVLKEEGDQIEELIYSMNTLLNSDTE